MVPAVPHHLEPVPTDPSEEPLDPFAPDGDPRWGDGEDDDPAALAPRVRPAWWRWVAVAVVLALVVAGPLAFVLLKLLG